MKQIENTVYEVRHIGVRNSKLYDTKEHMLIIMPNNLLANNKIVNLSEPDDRKFNENNIEIPFPQRVLHLKKK